MDVLDKKWIFVESGSAKSSELFCEDDSVFTVDDEEVIGCSEWMRCYKETFIHIVELHNAWLSAQTKGYNMKETTEDQSRKNSLKS